ncbi:hypothetical protein BC833DRAFT_521602 [Globomyces pollinis-pini]|nr:hypothetical protein BC833DRAFT_521602 [Globomyces pollinis-pini]KAJ2999032.1 hypothetical protein HDV02_003725 [Globomyces sp. JEL0801]
MVNPSPSDSVFHCLYCGEYVLTVDSTFDLLPKRPVDSSIVLDEDKLNVHINMSPIDPVIIKRASGFEKQLRYSCPGCQLPLAYHQGGRYLYILQNAVGNQKEFNLSNLI